MAKAFVVIKNGNRIVERADSKQEAEARAEALLVENPSASYEFGKLDKRIFNNRTESVYVPGEENY